MLVDSHVHAVSGDVTKYPLSPHRVDVPGATVHWFREAPVPVEQLLSDLTRAAVARAVLVQAYAAYGTDNSYVADALPHSKELMAGVGVVDDQAPNALERTRYWIQARGLRGIRIVASAHRDGAPLCDPLVWREAAALQVPLCFLMTIEQAEQLERLAGESPRATVVIEHAAYASAALERGGSLPSALLRLGRLPNIYVKYSTMNFDALRMQSYLAFDFVRRLADAFGAEHLLWGSNYPATNDRPYARLLQEGLAAATLLNPEERSWVMGRTAQRVFGAVERWQDRPAG